MKRLLLFLVAFPALLLTLEAGYFVWVLTGDKPLHKADLIVVFETGPDWSPIPFCVLRVSSEAGVR